ncbi:hypothetical protein ABID76_001128 [Burkholderia ambifaria]
MRVLSSTVGQRTHCDPAGRVLQQTIQRSTSPAPLAERRYRYVAAGQLSRIEDCSNLWYATGIPKSIRMYARNSMRPLDG